MSSRKKQQQQKQHDFLPNYASNGKKPLGPARRIGLPRNVRPSPSPNAFKSPMITAESASTDSTETKEVASTPPSGLMRGGPRIGLSRIIKPSPNAFKSPMLTPKIVRTENVTSPPTPSSNAPKAQKKEPRKSVRRNILDEQKEEEDEQDDKDVAPSDDQSNTSDRSQKTMKSSVASVSSEEDAQELTKTKKTSKKGAIVKVAKALKDKKAGKMIADEKTDEQEKNESQDGADGKLPNVSTVSNKSIKRDIKQADNSTDSDLSPQNHQNSIRNTPDKMDRKGRSKRSTRRNILTDNATPSLQNAAEVVEDNKDKEELVVVDGEESPDCPILSPQMSPTNTGRPKRAIKRNTDNDVEDKIPVLTKEAEVAATPKEAEGSVKKKNTPMKKKALKGRAKKAKMQMYSEEDVAPEKKPQEQEVPRQRAISISSDDDDIPLVKLSKPKAHASTAVQEVKPQTSDLDAQVEKKPKLDKMSSDLVVNDLDTSVASNASNRSNVSDMETLSSCNLQLEMTRNEVCALEKQIVEKGQRVQALTKQKQRVAELDALTKRWEIGSKEALILVHQKITAMGENVDMDALLSKFHAPEGTFKFDAFEYSFV